MSRQKNMTTPVGMDDDDDDNGFQVISETEVLEILYNLQKNMIRLAAEENKQKKIFDGNLLEDDAVKMKEFCNRSRISQFSQSLAELVSFLEWQMEKQDPEIHETSVYNALLRLEKAGSNNKSDWEILDHDGGGLIIDITHFEVNMVEQVISSYIADLLGENTLVTLFFPMNNVYEPDVIVKWRILEKIGNINLAAHESIYKQKLAECLSNRIKKETEEYLNTEFQNLELSGKNVVLKDIDALIKILKTLRSHVTAAIEVIRRTERTLFKAAGCSYLDCLAEVLDEKLIPVCQQVMESMDAYQQSHKEFHVNMRDSCALSHAFYLQLKQLVHLIKGETEGISLRLEDYSSVFGEFFLNLLHVMKSECHSRIKRAVEVEAKDTIHVEEKIFSSSVIVLNCFCTVIDEWKHLEIEDEELRTAALIKITDIICDGAKIFAEALGLRLGTFNLHFKDFEYAKKACILANSVQHVRQYLQNLPGQMNWPDSLENVQGDQPSGCVLKDELLRILNLIHRSMDSHLEEIETNMLALVVYQVQHPCEKQLSATFLYAPFVQQNSDKLLHTLNQSLEVLHKITREDLFPKLLLLLWTSLLTYVIKGIQEGQPPEYAKTVKQNIEDLKEYLLFINMEDDDSYKSLYDQLMNFLELNSKTTMELQLDYYSQLAERMISPVEYLGHIAFQAGYKTITDDLVELYINIQKGQRLPVRKFEISELCVRIELCPNTMFPGQFPVKTSPITEDLDSPVFNEQFQFCKLPSAVVNVKGAVIQVLVLNQDNSYSAEAVLLLNQVQNMSGLSSLEFLPVYLMPLRKFDMSHTSFQVLESRSRWDRSAKIFVAKRAKIVKNPKKFPSCFPGKGGMCFS